MQTMPVFFFQTVAMLFGHCGSPGCMTIVIYHFVIAIVIPDSIELRLYLNVNLNPHRLMSTPLIFYNTDGMTAELGDSTVHNRVSYVFPLPVLP